MRQCKWLWPFVCVWILASPCRAQRTGSNPLGGNLSVQDAGTCSTSGSYLWQVLPANANQTTVNLSGTFSATLTVRLSNNGGGSWVTVGTLSAAGTTTYSTNGYTDICVDLTAYTSGSAGVTLTTGIFNGNGGSGGVPSQQVAPNSTAFIASSNCSTPPQTNCYSVKGGVRWSYNAQVTNGSPTITCTDCAFTPADNGDIAFVTNSQIYGSVQQITSVTVLPQSTITFVDATHVTASNNATATCNTAGQCRISFGPADDTTALHSAALAAAAACGTEYIQAGSYFVSSVALVSDPAPRCKYTTYGTVGARGAAWQVIGEGLVNLIPLPSFNFSSCVPVLDGRSPCLIGGQGLRVSNINIDGAGQSYNGQSESVDIVNMDAGTTNTIDWINVSCHGWLAGATNAVGLSVNSILQLYGEHDFDACGSTGVYVLSGGRLVVTGGYFGDNLNYVFSLGGALWSSYINAGAVTTANACIIDMDHNSTSLTAWTDVGSFITLNAVTGGTSGNSSVGVCINQGNLSMTGTTITGGNNNFVGGINAFSSGGATKNITLINTTITPGTGTGSFAMSLSAGTTTINYNGYQNLFSGTVSLVTTDLRAYGDLAVPVSSLGTCDTSHLGWLGNASDVASPTYHSTVTGGGSSVYPTHVVCETNGTTPAWIAQ